MTKQNPRFNLVDFIKVLNGDNHYAFTDMWNKRNRSRNITKRLKKGDFRLSKNDELNMKRLRKLGKVARQKAREKYLGRQGVKSLRKAVADNLRDIYRNNQPVIYNASQLTEVLNGKLPFQEEDDYSRFEWNGIVKGEKTVALDKATDVLKKGHFRAPSKAKDVEQLVRAAEFMRSQYGVDPEKVEEFKRALDTQLEGLVRVRRIPKNLYHNNQRAGNEAARQCALESTGLRGLLYEKGKTAVKWFNRLYSQFKKADVELVSKDDPRIKSTKKDMVQARNGLIGTINNYLATRKERAAKRKLAAQRGARIAEENSVKIKKKVDLTHNGRVVETVAVEKDLNDYHRIKENLRDRYFEEQDLLRRLTPAQVEQYAAKKDQFVGEEAYEQLLKVAAYNELQREAEFDLRAKVADTKARLIENVAEARQRFAQVEKDIKAQDKVREKEQRRARAYQSYLDNYATRDGRQLTREEFDIVADNCKARDKFTVFKDEATGSRILYSMPRTLEKKIDEASISVAQKEAHRKKALKKGLFGEAEEHFKRRDAYFDYIKKRPADGKYMTFDQYTAFKNTVKKAEFQEKMNIANIDGQEGIFEITNRAYVTLTDGTTLEAELDFADAAKIRDYAAGRVAQTDADRQEKVHDIAKQYAKLNLRRRLLKKAEEHYIARKEAEQPVEEPVPVLEDWRIVGQGVGSEVYAN